MGAGAGRKSVRILFSSAGRRVELIAAFARAARSLGLKAEIHCADAEGLFAAAHVADRVHRVPAARSDGYTAALLDVASKYKIDLLVPLIDLELQKLAEARDAFAQSNCHVLISSPRAVHICQDKLETYRFLMQHRFDTPTTWMPDELREKSEHALPYFLKPRQGSASQGNFVIRTPRDLDLALGAHPDAIIQEFVAGVEHTLDVYAGFDGVPRCVVPRQRIEVRGGEVTKARTVRHEGIIDIGAKLTQTLGECVGLVTIQVILTPDGRIRVIEINPRFGGGVPLAIKAGANFPKWLLQEWQGKSPSIRPDGWQNGLTMLRYHQSFFEDSSGAS